MRCGRARRRCRLVNEWQAQVGSLATGKSKNFTAIGDVVNTAARLQSVASANEILVSEKVYGALSGEKPQADRTTLDLREKLSYSPPSSCAS